MKRKRIDSLGTAGSLFILALILMCTVILAFCIMTPINISNAMQKPSIMQIQRQLNTKGPFDAKVGSWFEQKAMENVVMNYNKENRSIKNDKQYEIYKLGKNHFWITNERMQQDEISFMTLQYFQCIDSIQHGKQTDENEFCFRCVTEEQKKQMEDIINESKPAEGTLDIKVDKEEKGEVTFVKLIVAPK